MYPYKNELHYTQPKYIYVYLVDSNEIGHNDQWLCATGRCVLYSGYVNWTKVLLTIQYSSIMNESLLSLWLVVSLQLPIAVYLSA